MQNKNSKCPGTRSFVSSSDVFVVLTKRHLAAKVPLIAGKRYWALLQVCSKL